MTDTAPGNVYHLIPQAMAEIGAIRKSERNDFDGYHYRGIDSIYNALHGPLSSLGLFIVPHKVESVEHVETKSSQGKPQLETRLVETFRIYAGDGSYVEAQVAAVGVDRGDKGANKAHTAAFKTLCFELFMPPLKDDSDSERESPDRAPAPARQQERKPSPLAAARDALVAWVGPYRDERIDGGGGVSDLDFLAAVSRAEYGDEGANTLERIDALRKVIEAGGYALETGKAK